MAITSSGSRNRRLAGISPLITDPYASPNRSRSPMNSTLTPSEATTVWSGMHLIHFIVIKRLGKTGIPISLISKSPKLGALADLKRFNIQIKVSKNGKVDHIDRQQAAPITRRLAVLCNLVCCRYKKISRNIMGGTLIPIPSHRKNATVIKGE